ncbi:MAG: hypothetical protein ABIH69_03265 [bacterium]
MDTYDKMSKEDALALAKASVASGIKASLSICKHKSKLCEQASTMEEFIEAKKNLMFALINALPLRVNDCPFCHLRPELTKKSCGACEYSIEHGICMEDDSVYKKITVVREHLLGLISFYGFKKFKYGFKEEGEI